MYIYIVKLKIMKKLPKLIKYLPDNYQTLPLQTQYDLARKQMTNILYVGKHIIKNGTSEQKQEFKTVFLKYNEIERETLDKLVAYKYPEIKKKS